MGLEGCMWPMGRGLRNPYIDDTFLFGTYLIAGLIPIISWMLSAGVFREVPGRAVWAIAFSSSRLSAMLSSSMSKSST